MIGYVRFNKNMNEIVKYCVNIIIYSSLDECKNDKCNDEIILKIEQVDY